MTQVPGVPHNASVVVSAPDLRSSKQLSDQQHVIEVLEIDQEFIDSDLCVICMTEPKDCVMYPCGHQCFCHTCSKRFKEQARHYVCPICRNRVKDVIKVFK